MKRTLQCFAGVFALAAVCCGFSSGPWLVERNDDSDAARLRAAYAACTNKFDNPAEDVVFPLEYNADGTVKSRLRAASAQIFLDTGFILGKGVRVEQYGADGRTTNGFLVADSCIVDRKTKTGWVEGAASFGYGKTVVTGRGVYFSFEREFVKIFAESKIRSTELKLDARRLRK